MTIELHGSGHGTVRGQKVVGHEPARKLVRSSPATGDWIDFRASLARVARREESGERPEVCAGCGTEVDVPRPAHSPRCEFAQPEQIRPVEESQPLAAPNPGGEVVERDVMEEVDAAQPPSEPTAHVDGAKHSAWTKEEIVAVIQSFAAEHGRPPKSDEWQKAEPGRPTTSTVVKWFGKWSLAIAASGFERPAPGGQRGNGNRVMRERPAAWLVVPGRGLRYRTTMEAYVAADEIEADGERVAREARVAGHEGKADAAIDKSRELAEEIRAVAQAAEDSEGGSRPGRAVRDAATRPLAPSDPERDSALGEPEQTEVETPPRGPTPASPSGSPSEPSLREALAGLLGAAIVVLEAAQRELLVETSVPGERPLRLTVRPR